MPQPLPLPLPLPASGGRREIVYDCGIGCMWATTQPYSRRLHCDGEEMSGKWKLSARRESDPPTREYSNISKLAQFNRGCSHITSAKKGIHNRGTIEEVLQKCWQNRSETQYGSRFQTDFKHCVIATGGQVQILWPDLDCFKPIKTANAVQKLGLGWS